MEGGAPLFCCYCRLSEALGNRLDFSLFSGQWLSWLRMVW